MNWDRANDLIGKLHTTHTRVLVTIGMEILFVMVILACIALKRPVQLDVTIWLGVFITAWMGIDVSQFRIDRKNPAAPPTPPDAG